jgi:hypothetical protein
MNAIEALVTEYMAVRADFDWIAITDIIVDSADSTLNLHLMAEIVG